MTRRQRFGAVALIAGSLLLAFSLPFALQQAVPGWEITLFQALNGVDTLAAVQFLARVFSDLVWVLVFAAGATILFWPGKRAWGWSVGVAIGASYVASAVIEHIVGRGRPESVLAASDVVMRASQDGYGFPSGHEAAITLVVLVFWRYLNWPLRIVGLLLIIAVGWSRIYLGVHFPLDIIGGIGVGLITAGCVWLAPKAWLRRFRIKF